MTLWKTELEDILEVASADSDQWVSMLAELLRSFPGSGTLNFNIEENSGVFVDLCNDLRKLVKKHADKNILPLECLYLNKHALTALVGQLPQPVKHFALKRKPKSAALRAELLQNRKQALVHVCLHVRNLPKDVFGYILAAPEAIAHLASHVVSAHRRGSHATAAFACRGDAKEEEEDRMGASTVSGSVHSEGALPLEKAPGRLSCRSSNTAVCTFGHVSSSAVCMCSEPGAYQRRFPCLLSLFLFCGHCRLDPPVPACADIVARTTMVDRPPESDTTVKRKRTTIPLAVKRSIVREHNAGEKVSSLVLKYGLPQLTVSCIIRNALKQAESDSHASASGASLAMDDGRKRVRHGAYKDMEDALRLALNLDIFIRERRPAPDFKFIFAAWAEVGSSTIVNCFCKVGLAGDSSEAEVEGRDAPADAEMIELWSSVNGGDGDASGLEEFLHADDAVATNEDLTDEAIVAAVTGAEDDSSDDEEEPELMQAVSHQEALQMIDSLRDFVFAKNLPLGHAQQLCISSVVFVTATAILLTHLTHDFFAGELCGRSRCAVTVYVILEGYRSVYRELLGPLRGIPSRVPTGGFKTPTSGNRLSSGTPLSRSLTKPLGNKKDGGIKLLDINEQPLGYGRDAKRRKKPTEEIPEMQKKDKEAPTTPTTSAAPVTPDYAAGLLSSSQWWSHKLVLQVWLVGTVLMPIF
ncbi:hypothetical protein HPB52_019612 [Rhipicephalus sanguineus]|uniref:HDAg domain-containing protein n=1 Tax=Rhipicephalus sanguineus TaxID=34632 RepID=A0A9D4T4A1_RHISA|nr:hypothetical protein HPB52_019612 [Rhipicephalus sanguineus]